LKLEKAITETVRVFQEENLNLFGAELNQSNLYNLCSSEPLSDEVVNDVLKCYSNGKELMKKFSERLLDGEKKFHDPISWNPIKSFKIAACTKVISKNNKESTVRVNRDIIRFLLSFSANNNQPIDWSSALTYPLSPIPLCLSTAGIKCKSHDQII